MKQLIKEIVQKTIKNLYDVEIEPQIQLPKEESYGNFASNIAFILSKALKQKPQDIAITIADNLKNLPHFEKVEALNGFVNMKLSSVFYEGLLFEFLENPINYIKDDAIFEAFGIKKEDKINLEYVSANPTGPLHLGHGRGAVIGDVLYRLFRFFDIKVDREYYINDAGNQVNLLAKSVMHYINQDLYPFPEDGYKGDYIKDIAEAFLKEHNKSNINLEINLERVKDFAISKMMEDIKNTLKLLNVEFDIYFSEKTLKDKVEKVLELLKEKNLIEEKEGAIWFKSKDEDKDRVLRKSDGSYTYFASDIAYHLDKYQRGYKKAIDLWGADHHGYIPRLKAALEALDIPQDWLSVELFQIVKLFENGQEVRMSKRTGKMLKLIDVIEDIGADNLRFMFLTKKADTPLDIDINLVKAQNSENPVFYVQYAYARTMGIKRQLKEPFVFGFYKDKYTYEEEELDLIKRILSSKDVLFEGVIKKDPSLVVKLSLDIAKSFHKFYNTHKVITSDEITTKKRISLVYATQKIFDIIFDILSIKAPEMM
ncbi:arginyl-tRNA synthetase [Hydrogenobaculum sp. Y04AAS1]|uniref:arginine--tRNA ligase n=1 Tax=Hydrogenobaculum sp. (strain Y04AAS1) TaxID=380749 RepID=UPI00015BCD91|nr:arginyl-tRNA synthetase [Hydrogenobaculum sp. Y04AAS1]HCT66497.1 arginine--tRNA ligase [Hydrogenobaculum sp.]